VQVVQFPEKHRDQLLQDYMKDLKKLIKDTEIVGIAVVAHYANGDVNVSGAGVSSGDLAVSALLLQQWSLATLSGEE
jgi:hypothetical protein